MNSFALRLKDISKIIKPDGKPAFGKRIQFAIESLLELRKNKWQKKQFKEQAKTKAAVRDEVEREARQHGMFSYQTVGVRPSYIDDISTQKKSRPKADAGAQKVKWDQAFVKRICQYYGEDKDGNALQAEWAKAPTDQDVKQGIDWLLEMGFDDSKKADIVALTLAEIMNRKLAPWPTLQQCFAPFLGRLSDMMMDDPHCVNTVHCLMARLLMLESFNSVMLKPFQHFVSNSDNCELGWSLMLGIIKKLKTEKQMDIVKKAIGMSDFSSCAATAKKTTVPDAKKQLEAA
eukprot:symbB.v1.2.041228.t1/scaffold7949.1/size8494/2